MEKHHGKQAQKQPAAKQGKSLDQTGRLGQNRPKTQHKREQGEEGLRGDETDQTDRVQRQRERDRDRETHREARQHQAKPRT